MNIVTEAWKAPVFKKHLTESRVRHRFNFNTAETLVFIEIKFEDVICLSGLIRNAELDAELMRVHNARLI